ncbi:hypothetical protein NQ318_013293 [Aromia moschata]|uniref:DUF659 domain-containing protein n=1 Tax=Aromia moschata TaxID=1265417 RepID=A0AAV8XZF4_9CUCU|nr:hypothetical protein NQ318_013293 [Aromia moschata]
MKNNYEGGVGDPRFELLTNQVVMIFMTDDGPTMLLVVGHLLSKRSCKFLHVTCTVHTLHLIIEILKQSLSNVDALIAVLFLNPKPLLEFHSKGPGIPEPPQPILTSCELNAAFHYAQHSQQIKAVFYNSILPKLQLLWRTKFQDVSVETAIKIIHKQCSALSLAGSLQIVDEGNSLLQAIGDAINEPVKNKFERKFERLGRLVASFALTLAAEISSYYHQLQEKSREKKFRREEMKLATVGMFQSPLSIFAASLCPDKCNRTFQSGKAKIITVIIVDVTSLKRSNLAVAGYMKLADTCGVEKRGRPANRFR